MSTDGAVGLTSPKASASLLADLIAMFDNVCNSTLTVPYPHEGAPP